MHEIMRKLSNRREYEMGETEMTILYYAHDRALFENGIQQFQHQFNRTTKSFKIVISASKTNYITTSKTLEM